MYTYIYIYIHMYMYVSMSLGSYFAGCKPCRPVPGIVAERFAALRHRRRVNELPRHGPGRWVWGLGLVRLMMHIEGRE